MAISKFWFPLSLAFVGTMLTGQNQLLAQTAPPPEVINCDDSVPIGDADACHAAAAVLFSPESTGSSGFPNGSSKFQLTDLNASVDETAAYTNSFGVNFLGTGISQVTTDTGVQIRNDCQIELSGPSGLIISTGLTATVCGGAFEDELIATNPDGSAADLGTLTFVWEINDLTLRTAVTSVGQQLIMNAGFSFGSSADPSVNIPISSLILSQDSLQPSSQECSLNDNGTTSIFASTIGDNGEAVCEQFIESLLVSVEVDPMENNRYVFAGAASGLVANTLLVADFQDQGFSASASVENNNTVTLSSILLSDGRTPEEQGAMLSFGSGVNSPNPVPEPLTILGTISAVGFGAFFKRQLRRKG